MMILEQNFFDRNTNLVAQELLGKILVRKYKNIYLKVRITETEAYHGFDDLASQASRGRTPRTEVMYGEAGLIYVYLIYGMYYCLNLVTMPVDFPAAVLIRTAWPIEGMEQMRKMRGKDTKFVQKNGIEGLTNGPGKLCQALAIDKHLNNKIIGMQNNLWIEEDGYVVRQKDIVCLPRVGVDYARHCREWKWRYKLMEK